MAILPPTLVDADSPDGRRGGARRPENLVAAQAVGTVAGAAVLVFVAFRVGRRSTGPAAKPAPRPLVVGIGAFAGSSAFFAMAEGWPGFVACVVLLAVAAVVVARLSRRPGWQDRHRLALASGALFTYAWGGFVLTWHRYPGGS